MPIRRSSWVWKDDLFATFALARSEWMGGGQAVMRDFKRSVNYGASDPRKDGAAVPEVPAQR